ncbi:hypothetical protein ACJMK2_043817 [Sinanodonta woodiana]|uniref:Uncharacterized protein n=1 Tax=Sinanodonta woodiana TaxID=1069815 RepID=A0ABD3VY23_SINWO
MGNESSQASGSYGEPVDNDIEVTWESVSADYRFPLREGQCTCSHGNKMYIFGGVLQSDTEILESNELHCFDIDTKTWSKVVVKGQIPPPRSAASLVSVGNKLLLFGGLSQECGWFDDVHIFDTEISTWQLLETEGRRPSPRDKLQAVAFPPFIYYFGGFGPKILPDDDSDDDGEEMDDEEVEVEEIQEQDGAEFVWFNDLFVLDTSTRKWSQPMQMNLGVPTARAAHAMCGVGRNLVIFGGRDTECRRNDLHIFNIDTRKWDMHLTVKGRLPEPRSFHTATAVGNRVVVMGGRGNNNEHFADFHVFDTDTKEWLQPKVKGKFPTARGQHSAVTVGDYLVLFGGSGRFSPETMQCHQFFSDTFILQTGDVLKGGSKPKPDGEKEENATRS